MADINMTKTDFFSTTRITRLVQTLASELEVSQPLTFLNRTPIVPVLDDIDILGSYSGPIFAADLITEDAEAVVVEGGRFEQNASIASIPKIKIGQRVSESIIRRLTQLKQGIQLAGDTSVVTGWELDFATTLIRSVRERENALCAAMMLDNHTYDRLGVKLSGSFGAPSAMKVTLLGGDKWTPANTATMTPVDDLQMLVQTATVDFSKTFNRATMSTLAFSRMTSSAEFTERVRLMMGLQPGEFYLSPYDTQNLQNYFTRITGLQLELEDNSMRVRNVNGGSTQTRYLPANQVLLSRTEDDNNRGAFDFANGIVTESIVAPLIAGAPDFGGEQVGPVAYYDGNISLNPPDLKCWAVARGFPRKHDKNATAVITVAADETLTA